MSFFVFPVPFTFDEQILKNHMYIEENKKKHDCGGCKLSTFAFVRVISCGENMHFRYLL